MTNVSKKLIAPILISLLFLSCKSSSDNSGRKIGESDYPSKDFNGKIWMTKNLNETIDSAGLSISYYIPNNDSSKVQDYDLLYDYETACRVCPTGWHLPTADEWDELINSVGRNSNHLKDSILWTTMDNSFSNSSGFSIRPAGYGNTGEFDNLFGTHAIFWSSTKIDSHFAKGYVLGVASDSMRSAAQHPTYAFSIRCIKDTSPKIK